LISAGGWRNANSEAASHNITVSRFAGRSAHGATRGGAVRDGPALSRRTRELLGWQPKQRGLIADLDGPGYSKAREP
jgi:hypothetical protein